VLASFLHTLYNSIVPFLLREFIGLLLPMSPTWSVHHWRKIRCLLLSDMLLLHRGWRNCLDAAL